MIEKPTVVVLMSTYNGAAHLEEQIESIINQEDVNVRLIIRDDGSKDDTVALAKKYTDEVIEGSNLGYRYSFLELIRNAPDADYYALSDQDDIWKPQKLVSATKMIEKQESNFGESHPVLYASSRSNIINGKVVEAKELNSYKKTPFNGFDNGYHLQGCTMVFNNSLKSILTKYIPQHLITSHDVWIHQLCKAMNGVVIYDPRPTLLYRLESNTIGVPKNRVLERVKGLFIDTKESDIINLCSNIIEGYHDSLPSANLVICVQLCNYKKEKIKVLFNPLYYKGRWSINIYRFVAFLFNKA